ncbi:bifunctional 2',3'-cyclic-nucleotide 2'-phosphodiesterase/3'-nucleotidase [Paenibacillus sp. HJL G12]|uniref:Bifunctional 2',3'-cyclic-nucleotide 2'-phosphodiesterase/3'-nucleotidase n=2 Tax=Paenibacillus dendrobii TaxID=2691084 RepID=A0A7X3LKW2_9BACL|nr:bifunctional 2',3'-cyclic-nucleotide 2'-phosphodiesterase/3'-nucleotidase [Paenibacillus dendrobii]MWV47003.1 bifunctional 2',3'-cyclic-nucleotide 2'-phosphodiesterase/3'-nucleotidase [Paenibacillus dendrobii]
MQTDAEPTMKLRIMSTTDVHACLMDYDYYRDRRDPSLGLCRTASLVKQARAEVENAVLVDNGDLIQGTPLGTFAARIDSSIFSEAEPFVHPAIAVMNAMGYDAATFGNHEFNYGLDYLDQVIAGADFPYVNANVYVHEQVSGSACAVNRYTPYVILNKSCLDSRGERHNVRIGCIGLVPPQILDWDAAHLNGRIQVKDMVLSALEWIPRMREEGADVIIALAHTGFDADVSLMDCNAENAVLPLSLVPGIDAIAFSHTHKIFPVPDFHSLNSSFKGEQGAPVPAIELGDGTINGLPAVQAGYGGAQLGIIDLSLQQVDGNWQVVHGRSMVREVYDRLHGLELAEPDLEITRLLREVHQNTVMYANAPIGRVEAPLHSYFSLVQEEASLQLLNQAQCAYARSWIASYAPHLRHLPVLSVGSPFKAGRNGPNDYADIPAGPVAIKSATELYLFDNTVKGVKMTGVGVKEWLEMAAGIYNQIDPAEAGEQPLLNPLFAVFNFDVIGGITYQVDVTQPARYKPDGSLHNPCAGRIANLQYQGRPVDPDQEFILVSSNYRVFGGGNFPGLREAELVLDSADENRQVLIDYIAEQGYLEGRVHKNWSFVPIAHPVNVTFPSSPDAVKYIGSCPRIDYTERVNEQGYGLFRLNLSVQKAENAVIFGEKVYPH